MRGSIAIELSLPMQGITAQFVHPDLSCVRTLGRRRDFVRTAQNLFVPIKIRSLRLGIIARAVAGRRTHRKRC